MHTTGSPEVAKLLLGVGAEERDADDGIQGGDDAHDEEGVEHGVDGRCDRVDDGLDRLELPEDADDAECAHQADMAHGEGALYVCVHAQVICTYIYMRHVHTHMHTVACQGGVAGCAHDQQCMYM